MALKRLFSHHSHSGHRSHHDHLELPEEVQRSFSDDTHEHHDIVKPIRSSNAPDFGVEQQAYRARRRSSIQILDKKFIQSLSIPSSPSDLESPLLARNISEDVCKFQFD